MNLKFKIFVTVVLSLMWIHSINAQSNVNELKNDVNEVNAQWEKFFSSVQDSAIVNDGKLIFVKMPISGIEKQLSFEHAADSNSFTITDEKGIRLEVFLNNKSQISRVLLPNGKYAVFDWRKTENNIQILQNVKIDGTNLDLASLVDAPGGNVCRDAAVAATIALGICAATGGASVACWSATASAAYLAYRCYEQTH